MRQQEYISREAATDAAFRVVVYNFGAIEEDKELFSKEMDALTAADVAPVVRGRWEPISIVVDNYSGRLKHGYECNKCGFFTQRLFNGCPMCFARMNGGEHHAD